MIAAAAVLVVVVASVARAEPAPMPLTPEHAPIDAPTTTTTPATTPTTRAPPPTTTAPIAKVAEARDEKPAVIDAAIDGGARFGVTAGNVLAAPFVVPGPGAFISAKARVTVVHLVEGRLEAAVALGVGNPGDPNPVAGYKGRGLIGVRLDAFDMLTFRVDAHAGISSIVLLPAPRFGLGGEIVLHTPIGEHFDFDVKGRIDGDFVLIVPAPAGSVEAGGHWFLDDKRNLALGLHAGADADAIVAIVANTVSASVFVSASLSMRM